MRRVEPLSTIRGQHHSCRHERTTDPPKPYVHLAKLTRAAKNCPRARQHPCRRAWRVKVATAVLKPCALARRPRCLAMNPQRAFLPTVDPRSVRPQRSYPKLGAMRSLWKERPPGKRQVQRTRVRWPSEAWRKTTEDAFTRTRARVSFHRRLVKIAGSPGYTRNARCVSI
jgi:hypothetical protein